MKISRKDLLAAIAVSAVLFLSPRVTPAQQGSPPLSPEQIAQIVASPDRSAADRTNDLRRKPEQMLGFIGIRPGIVALDLSAAGGYTTELLARAIGASGTVYGQSQPRDPSRMRANPERRARIVERLRSGGGRPQQPLERALDVAGAPVRRHQGVLRPAQKNVDPGGLLAHPPRS